MPGPAQMRPTSDPRNVFGSSRGGAGPAEHGPCRPELS